MWVNGGHLPGRREREVVCQMKIPRFTEADRSDAQAKEASIAGSKLGSNVVVGKEVRL